LPTSVNRHQVNFCFGCQGLDHRSPGPESAISGPRDVCYWSTQREYINVQNNIFVKRDFLQWKQPRQYHEAEWT